MQQIKQQRKARGPLHHFPEMQASERLMYEILTAENYPSLVEIFFDDDSEFTDQRFKNLTLAEQYAIEIGESIYQAKHGGCDFLIKLKITGEYIGILHLFDYSLETFSDVPKRCSIGFAIAKSHRRQYYATEAVRHLMEYAHATHQKTKFLAYTKIPNNPANALLASLGMTLKNEDYYYGGDDSNYYVLERSPSSTDLAFT